MNAEWYTKSFPCPNAEHVTAITRHTNNNAQHNAGAKTVINLTSRSITWGTLEDETSLEITNSSASQFSKEKRVSCNKCELQNHSNFVFLANNRKKLMEVKRNTYDRHDCAQLTDGRKVNWTTNRVESVVGKEPQGTPMSVFFLSFLFSGDN